MFDNQGRFSRGAALTIDCGTGWVTPSCWAIGGYFAFALMLLYVMLIGVGWDMRNWALDYYLMALASVMILWKILRPTCIGTMLDRLPLSTILLITVFMRVTWVLSSGVTQTSDFEAYEDMAAQMSRGGGWCYPSFPAGAPLFYAFLYNIFGRHPLVPQLALTLISTAQVFFIYAIVRRTMGGDRAGKIAALVLAFWPENLFYVNLVGADVPFTTLVLAAVWLLWREQRGYLLRLFAAGVLLGMANWVRPNAPVVLAAVFLFVLLRKIAEESWLRRIGYCSAVALGFAIVVSPIIVLNHRYYHEYSFIISKKSGFNMMFGTSLESQGGWNTPDIALIDAEAAKRTCPAYLLPEVMKNDIAREIALERIRQNPWAILKMAVRHKIVSLWAYPASLCWSFETSRFMKFYGTACTAAVYYHLIMVTLAIWAIVRYRALFFKLDERWILVAFALLATVSHIVVEVQPRYHHACLPIFAICIAGYAQSLRQTAGRKIFPFAQGEAVERLFPEMRKAA